MYRIGIIDDTDELLEDYVVRLRREDIGLLVAPEGTMEYLYAKRNKSKAKIIPSRTDYAGKYR